MTYTLAPTAGVIIRDSDGAFIPPDQGNKDYLEYQAWVSAGNVPNPVPVPPVSVPQTIYDWQFFQAAAQLGIIQESDALAMISSGIIPPVLVTAIATLPAASQFSVKMKIVGSRSFNRDDQLMNTLSSAMGNTPAQVDALFTLAATL